MSFFTLSVDSFQLFFTGLWTIVLHYLGYMALALIGVAWLYLSPWKKEWGIYWIVAVVIGVSSYTVAIKNESDRCTAQIKQMQVNAINSATKVGKQGESDAESSRRDPQDLDAK